MNQVRKDGGRTQDEEMLGQRKEGLGGKGETGIGGEMPKKGNSSKFEAAGALKVCFGGKSLFPDESLRPVNFDACRFVRS